MYSIAKSSEPIRSVDRALNILLCFSQEEPVLSLTQLAERVGVPKSTVHRHLVTLESKRFIHRDEQSGMYQLGFQFIEMASFVLEGVDLPRWAMPYLEGLSAECGETVDLAVLEHSQVIYLLVVESHRRVMLTAAVGQRLPAWCTASGKAFLAFLPNDQVSTILDQGVTHYTDYTMTTREALLADLSAARKRGYAMSQQEYEMEINAIAAPIRNADGYPVAVIAIAGPSYRLPQQRMMELGQMILATVNAMAREVSSTALSAIVSNTTIPQMPKPF